MEIHYELTEEDVVNFNVYHVKHSKTGERSLRWQRFISPLLFLLFAYFLSVTTDIETGVLYVTFGVSAILWVVFYPKYFYWYITRQVQKSLREGKNDGLIGSHTMKLNAAGIVEITTSGESRSNWQAIKQFKEDKRHFYLYNSAVSSFIIPKRDVDEEQFRDFVKKKLADVTRTAG